MEADESTRPTDVGGYEGRLYLSGGDFIYTPKIECEPGLILASAKRAVFDHGGFDELGRVNTFVTIPGMGEFPFDENSTVESLMMHIESRRCREEIRGQISRLPINDLRIIQDFIKTLKR